MKLGLAPATALLLAGLGALPASAAAVDYLRDIKPVLTGRCYACHGALQQKGDLRVDTAAQVREGGSSGPAVVPGDPESSLLLAHVTAAQGKRRMPPASEGEALTPAQVEMLRAWVRQGAQGPPDEKPEPDPRSHWAFRAPRRPKVPVIQRAWGRNPIDAFLAGARQKQQLAVQPPADRRTLLRRVYLDLVGLPPSVEEQEAFLADPSPDAYVKVVDRLLASPQYGERWGRHWMDIWRYSDAWGLGGEPVRNSQKHLWHWRDWIVESLNADKGYDQMVREMLAADELYPTDLDRLRATGYLARQYFRFNRNTWMEETIEHTGKAFLGLTLNCARCHDHKFDPISQQDYYRFRAFFEPYQVRTELVAGVLDVEKDGIPRAYDCNLEAPTYRFLRGDESKPIKDRPLQPALPRLLAFCKLDIAPVVLPAEAHHPGLRPHILADHLRQAEERIGSARQELERAHKELLKSLGNSLAGMAPRRTGPFALAAWQGAVQAVSTGSRPLSELAQARVRVARKVLAAAELEPATLRARAAADRAAAQQPATAEAPQLAGEACRAERALALARAEEGLARAELEMVKAAAGRQEELGKKRAAAKQAVLAARKALASPGQVYSPLRGAVKSVESVEESEESRSRPFPRTSTGRRTALAQWITDPRNPLTARVAVNHVWARHFGRPLVPTLFELGRRGTPPDHPELLDWLACELVERGWSLKALHRLMVTSETYRLTSSSRDAPQETRKHDPENRSYWRAQSVRLDAQVLRDSLLSLAGELELKMGGPSVPATDEASRRRSLYFLHSHNDHQRLLSLFDDASVLECYRRQESIVPQQALALSNSRLAFEAAARIHRRLDERLGPCTDEAFVRLAFQTILACTPTPEEQAACLQMLTELGRQPGSADTGRARDQLIRALLNHNDFITIR